MKKTRILILLLSSLLLFSCGKSKKEKVQEEKTVKKESALKKVGKAFDQVKSAKGMAGDMETLNEDVENLKEMEPISNADLKSFFPEELQGLKRKSFSVGDSQSFFSITQGEATYSDGDRQIKITVTDGAGEAGSAVVPMAMWAFRTNSESESDKGFSKTTEKDGRRMKIEQKENRNRTDSSMDFGVNNRFLVNMKGQSLTADELEKAYKELKFSKLK